LYGRTPLHYACQFDKIRAMKFLMNNRAQIDMQDNELVMNRLLALLN